MTVKIDPALSRFILETRKYPLLTAEREFEISTAWHDRNDRAALGELVGSHLRLVVKIARRFAGYGLSFSDLVAEGNVGLMRAAEKFDPARGFRFATYARWWIRASIQEYTLRSRSLVRIGTTTAQRRLFFNLRRLKASLETIEKNDMTPEAVTSIAAELGVQEGEVIDMNWRMGGRDNSLNTIRSGTEDEWLEILPDERPSQEAVVIDLEERRRRHHILGSALKELGVREREIVVERRLRERPATLEELSHRYAVSPERVRQIEVHAFKKLQKIFLEQEELDVGSN